MNIQLKYVDLNNGERLAYREREGGTDVVVLLHGNMTSSLHWDLLLESLDPTFKVYAIDMRGFGESTYHRAVDSIEDFAEDIREVLSKLEIASCDLIGWSTGGAVALQVAAREEKQVRRVVLLASASTRGYPYYQQIEESRLERLETKEAIAADPVRTIPIEEAYLTRNTVLLKQIWDSLIYTKNQPSEERYQKYIDDMCTQKNLADVYYALNTFNMSEHHNGLVEGSGEVNNISQSVLILWGEHDLVISEVMTQELIEDLGERAYYVRLKDCGHSPLIDDLAQVTKVMEDFLKKKETSLFSV
ncbi:putative 3-oxoadipate enol lactonase [Alkalihalophilus pseudofirmus OF4]|uniref:3-oxoadipate enol lactonase n=1 Tax=Alkalihalophilus pseudofirmus (strain ATCC BAA-2126 / JCM 17055 / OF4) TaxID=398511 RepID=D3FX97_ALKPO|nr:MULTISPECIES: alpha/beta hydrolase [Alkalihalophilus]ADC48852.1 putative 3-oxoadipate enol lactonase [Alkalihalophilus pseudofirmus OF4]MED1600217.1 alpha/beta hydrolase [Alkalihalophilus marmarensis]